MKGRRILVWAMAGLLSSVVAPARGAAAEEEPGLKRTRADLESGEQESQQTAETAEKGQDAEKRGWRTYWDEGLHLESEGGNFKVKIGGRFMLDGAIIDPDASTREAFPDLAGTKGQIRRIRIYGDGTIYRNFVWKFQLDFYQMPNLLYKDVYVGMKNVPYLGTIRFGHQFEPFSLEEDTSTKFITMMERALPTLAFYPTRNTGLLVFNTALNKRLFWGAGAFIEEEDETPFEFAGDTGWNASGRITGLPWFGGSDGLLHLGLGYIHKFRSASTDDDWKVQLRPTNSEANLVQPLIDTGKLVSEGADYFSPELALVVGPFSVQGEYFHATVDRGVNDALGFQGFYVNASYFITGESRVYDPSTGSFGTVKPRRDFNFKRGSGWGSWEVALRYSSLDLNDKLIRGGAQRNITLGLNWQLDPNVRIMFNYVHIHVDETTLGTQPLVDGDTRVYQMRFQIAY